MNTLYECEVCGKQYSKASECDFCEKQPVNEPKFKIGDEVYVKQRYPDDRDKPFVAVTVVGVGVVGHAQRYQLSHFVEFGKGMWIGGRVSGPWTHPSPDEFESHDPAYEGRLRQIGDETWAMTTTGNFDYVPITEAMVNRDAELTSTERRMIMSDGIEEGKMNVEYLDRLAGWDRDKHEAAQKGADEKHNVGPWGRKGDWHKTYLEGYYGRKIKSLSVRNQGRDSFYIDMYKFVFESKVEDLNGEAGGRCTHAVLRERV